MESASYDHIQWDFDRSNGSNNMDVLNPFCCPLIQVSTYFALDSSNTPLAQTVFTGLLSVRAMEVWLYIEERMDNIDLVILDVFI